MSPPRLLHRLLHWAQSSLPQSLLFPQGGDPSSPPPSPSSPASVAARILASLDSSADVYTYTSLLTGLARNSNHRDVLSLFHKMLSLGIRPTIVTYNVLGRLFFPHRKILDLVRSMKNDGIDLDRNTYNTLIRYCQHGSLHKEAEEIFREMKVVGFVPDKVTYNALLDVYGKSRRHENDAMGVIREMGANEFSPNIVTYNSLISAYAKDGIFDEAVEMKEEMERKEINSDVVTYT